MSIFTELARRCRSVGPIRVAVIGTGFFGGGLVRLLEAIQVCADRESAQAALDRGIGSQPRG